MPGPESSQSETLTRPSRFAAYAAILCTTALMGGVLALLLYSAVNSPTPNRVIIVRSSSEWEGTQLIVEGGNLAQPQQTTIMKMGRFTVPFFVWPGKYKLHVKSQGVEVYSQDFDLTTETTQEVDLTRTGATTLPSTAPATEPSV